MYFDLPTSFPINPPKYDRPSAVILTSVSEKNCCAYSRIGGFTINHDLDAFG